MKDKYGFLRWWGTEKAVGYLCEAKKTAYAKAQRWRFESLRARGQACLRKVKRYSLYPTLHRKVEKGFQQANIPSPRSCFWKATQAAVWKADWRQQDWVGKRYFRTFMGSPPVQKPLRNAEGLYPIFASSEQIRVLGTQQVLREGFWSKPLAETMAEMFQSSSHLALHKEDALDLHRNMTFSAWSYGKARNLKIITKKWSYSEAIDLLC